MSDRYWNGYQWVENPRMSTLNEQLAAPTVDDFDMTDVKDTLLEVELNPRTKTTEEVKFEVEIEAQPGVPEQPTPNLVDKSVDVFSRNPVRRLEHEEAPVVSRATTRDRQEITGQPDTVVVDEPVITDETRARIRRELGMDDDSTH